MTKLHNAAIRGNIKEMVQLLENFNVDIQDLIIKRTPLHEAVWYGQFEAVKFLIENGADVSAKDIDGDTPLHVAASSSRLSEIAKFLIEKGADINNKNYKGISPLDTVKQMELYKWFPELIEA